MDYRNGKIYAWFIGKHLYIGSTAHTLDFRLRKHISKCNIGFTFRVYNKLREIGMDEISKQLILLRKYPCASKDELEMEEQRWIDRIQPDLNETSAYCYYNKKYKSKISTCTCGAKIRSNHLPRHKRSLKHKKWMIKNNVKETIPPVKKRPSPNCPCGGIDSDIHRRRHLHTDRHQRYLAIKDVSPRADLIFSFLQK